MGKKILKVTAIVLASVIGFVGVVIGIMAAMGKFKKPIVYPDHLSFAENEQLIVDNNEGEKHSFILSATSDSGEEVNQKSCYIWFTLGGNLITLDERYTMDSHGRYKVDCNTPIYYTVNKDVENYYQYSNYGLVQIRARDSREIVNSDVFNLWIDRDVEYIYLDEYSENYESATKEQNVRLNINQDLYFSNFAANPYSLNPVSNRDPKEVEIYYYDNSPELIDHYVPLSDGLNDVIFWDDENDCYYFKSQNSGESYTFKIAVFKSYAAKDEYENTVQNPQIPDYTNRVNSMISTTLTIDVESKDVDSVSIENSVNLDLYKESSFSVNEIGLKMRKGSTEIEDRYTELNFGLIESTNRTNWLQNGITFVSENEGDDYNVVINDNLVRLTGFTSLGIADNSYQYSIESTTDAYQLRLQSGQITFNINLGSSNDADGNRIEIGNKISIKSLSFTNAGQTVNLVCSNGLAFVDTTGDATYSIKALKTGSYLGFFNAETSNRFVLANEFDFEVVNTTGTKKDKTFTILTKNTVDDMSKLRLGVLAVNSDGKLYSAFTNLTITPKDDEPTFNSSLVTNNQFDLNINFENEGEDYNTIYNTIPLSEILNENTSSYNNFVLVTLEGTTEVLTYNRIKYNFNESTYVLVGYFDNGTFKNEVKVSEGAIGYNAKLYLLQLKTGYNSSVQEFLNNLLSAQDDDERDIILNDENVYKNYIQENRALTVNLKYDFKAEYLTAEYDAEGNDNYMVNGDIVKFVESTNDHKIYVTSKIPEMLRKAQLSQDNIQILINGVISAGVSISNITIINVEYEENGNSPRVIITFNTGAFALDRNFQIQLNKNGQNVTTEKAFNIISDAPDSIVLLEKTEGTETTINEYALSATEEEAQENNVKLAVEIGYDQNVYTYTYSYVDSLGNKHEVSYDIFAKLFNSEYQGTTDNGFVGSPRWLDKTYSLSYKLMGEDKIFDLSNLLETETQSQPVIHAGKQVIEISAGDAKGYILLEITALENFKLNLRNSGSIVTSTDTVTLDEVLSYYYDVNYNGTYDDGDINLIDKLNLEDIYNVQFGGGIGTIEIKKYDSEGQEDLDAQKPSKIEIWTTQKTGTEEQKTKILTAERKLKDEKEVWTFTRESFKNTSLSFNFNINDQTQEKPTQCFIRFVSNFMVEQNEKYTKLYQGTKINLYKPYDSNTGSYSGEPLFKITSTNSDTSTLKYTVDVVINGDKTDIEFEGDGSYLFASAGEYVFNFYTSDTVRETPDISFAVKVVPNVVLVPTAENEIDSDSQNIDANHYFELKSFDTNITYGTVVNGAVALYDESHYANDVALDEKLSIECDTLDDDNEKLITYGNSKFSTGWIKEIGASKVATLKFYYTDGEKYDLGELQLTVVNKYGINIDKTADCFKDNAFHFMSQVEYDENLFTITDTETNTEFKLTRIETENGIFEFSVAENQFKLNSLINSHFNSVELTFIYQNADASKELIYKNYVGKDAVTIVLEPYFPAQRTDKTYYTGDEIDLIADIFEDAQTTIENQGFIESLLITGIEFNDVYDDLTVAKLFTNYADIINNNGYHSGGTLENIKAQIVNNINYNSISLSITYQIKYTGDDTYSNTITITVYNRQKLEFNYPFKGFSEDQVGMRILGEDNTWTNSTIAIENYEPVRLGQTITFDVDNELCVTRADMLENGLNVKNKNLEISVVGYSNTPTTRAYFEANNVVIGTNSVTFNYSNNFNNGYFMLKLTTESGFTGYYYVRVQNTRNGDLRDKIKTASKNVQIDNEIITFKDALKDIDTSYLTTNYNFTTTNINNVEFYLLDVQSNDENVKFDDNILSGFGIEGIKRYEKIDKTTSIPEQNNYVKLRLALINNPQDMQHAGQIFCFGILDLYLQPKVSETVKDEYKDRIQDQIDGIKSGEYKAEIKEINTITDPFIDSLLGQGTFKSIELTNVSEGFDLEGNNIDYNGTHVVSVTVGTDGNVVFNKYVSEDLFFTAVYTYTNGGYDFILKINYTYSALEVNMDTQLETVGEFENVEKGFNNKMCLDDYLTSNNGTTYKGNLTITGLSDAEQQINLQDFVGDIELTKGGNAIGTIEKSATDKKIYIVFNQKATEQKYQMDITYDDLAAEHNTKRIDVTVLSGVYIAKSSDDDSGTSANKPCLATAIEDSTNNIAAGSKITVNYESKDAENAKYYVYKIGKIEFYTTSGNAQLEITFNEGKYSATKQDDNIVDKITANGQQDIQFVHTPEVNKILSLTLRLLDDENAYEYDNRAISENFYVKLQRTYTSITPIYSVVGSTYENVHNNQTIPNIYQYLFNAIPQYNDVTDNPIYNRYRLAINLGFGDLQEIDLTQMGFNTAGNPNNLTISSWGEGISYTSLSKSITFRAQTQTLTTLTLSNELGTVIEYKFNILPANEADGVQFESNSTVSNGTINKSDDEENKNIDYAVVKINDNGSETFDSPAIKVGNWLDETATKFYLKSAQFIKNDDEKGTPLAYGIINNGYELKDDSDNYTLQLYLKSEIVDDKIYNSIYVQLERKSDISNILKYELTLIGNGGVEKTIQILFYNYTLNVNYQNGASAIDAIAADASPIYLTEYIEIKANNGDDDTLSVNNLSLNKEKSSYSYKTYGGNLLNPSVTLCSLNEQDLTLTLYSVSETARLSLVFKVEHGKYLIGEITIAINQNNGFYYRVDGKETPTGQKSFESDLILNKQGLTDQKEFPYSVDLVDDTADSELIQYGTKNYLRQVYTQVFNNQDKGFKDIQFSVLSTVGIDKDYVNIDGTTLKIEKDFTGSITLEMKFRMYNANDYFTATWTINVQGFMDFSYYDEENAILYNKSHETFEAGDIVNPISSNNEAEGVAVTTQNTQNTLRNYAADIEDGLSYNVQYAVVNIQDERNYSVEKYFDGQYATQSININKNGLDGFSMALPNIIPESGSELFILAFKIDIKYLLAGSSSEVVKTVYASYHVRNNILFSIKDATINVDEEKIDGDKTNYFDKATNMLDLFNMTVNYSFEKTSGTLVGGDAFDGTVIYQGKDVQGNNIFKMTITGNTTLQGDWTSNDLTTFTNGERTLEIKESTEISKSTFSYYSSNEHGASAAASGIISISNEISNDSFYGHNFKSIMSFASFIDGAYIKLDNMAGYSGTEKEIYYPIEHIEKTEGHFGINLANPYKSKDFTGGNEINTGSGFVLFNNQLTAKMNLFAKDSTVAASSIDLTLTTNTVISPNGQYKFGDIFKSTSSYKDLVIIGVSTNVTSDIAKDWIDRGDATVSIGEDIKNITIDKVEYNIYEITYSIANASSQIYSVSATYYAIQCQYEDIVLVDYSTSPETNSFRVNYVKNQDSEFSLENVFVRYYMNDNTFTQEYLDVQNAGMEIKENSNLGTESETTYSTVNIEGKTITVTKEKLQEYKNANANATELSIKYTATYKGREIEFTVNFELPTTTSN